MIDNVRQSDVTVVDAKNNWTFATAAMEIMTAYLVPASFCMATWGYAPIPTERFQIIAFASSVDTAFRADAKDASPAGIARPNYLMAPIATRIMIAVVIIVLKGSALMADWVLRAIATGNATAAVVIIMFVRIDLDHAPAAMRTATVKATNVCFATFAESVLSRMGRCLMNALVT